jgi:hypothetical protein
MSFHNLRAFARYMLRDGRLQMPTELCRMHFDGRAFQLVMFRDGPWQLELVTLMPNIVVPRHSHPNVSTFGIYLGGSGALDSSEYIERQINKLRSGTMLGVTTPAGEEHGGSVGPDGLCFLSFQQWSVEPSMLHEDWQ